MIFGQSYPTFSKKQPYSPLCQIATNKAQYNTIESTLTDAQISNANFSIRSSRIADETGQISTHSATLPSHFQQLLRQKLEYFQAETCKLLQEKQRDIYFLQIELKNNETKFAEYQQNTRNKNELICTLKTEIQQLLSENSQLVQNNRHLQQTVQKMSAQNSRLKESCVMLKFQKKQCLKQTNKQDYISLKNNYNTHGLKRQVQDLKLMIAQMELSVKNCPSCFTLRRENEELAEAYNHLKDMYSQLAHQKSAHQKSLLQNINAKIQENQNIARENLQLKDKRGGSGLRSGRQKLKESVAKRCRTLTDQF